jgi:hypothetical protein
VPNVQSFMQPLGLGGGGFSPVLMSQRRFVGELE